MQDHHEEVLAVLEANYSNVWIFPDEINAQRFRKTIVKDCQAKGTRPIFPIIWTMDGHRIEASGIMGGAQNWIPVGGSARFRVWPGRVAGKGGGVGETSRTRTARRCRLAAAAAAGGGPASSATAPRCNRFSGASAAFVYFNRVRARLRMRLAMGQDLVCVCLMDGMPGILRRGCLSCQGGKGNQGSGAIG